MSCFGGAMAFRPGGGGRRPWRWWRTKCAGVAAAVRRSIKGLHQGQRRRSSGWRHRHHRQYRSFAPVYVDELYTHQAAAGKALNLAAVVAPEQPISTCKLASTTPATATTAGAATKAARAAAAGGVGAMRSVLLRSPGRRGCGGVLAAVKGMGEVDLRAELFIRKFWEEMRLQTQRSAEELQAMLARGL
ncbi:hypothetical protein ACP4OV_018249 [Aristida adscensionis]